MLYSVVYLFKFRCFWSLYPKETTDQIHVTNFFSFVFSNKHAPWMIFLQLPCNLRARSYSSKQLGNTNWQYVEAHQFKNLLDTFMSYWVSTADSCYVVTYVCIERRRDFETCFHQWSSVMTGNLHTCFQSLSLTHTHTHTHTQMHTHISIPSFTLKLW